MAPRHRHAYTDTHCANVSSSVTPFQNAGGISYRKTVTNLDSISLVTTPPSFLRPLSVMQKVFQLQMGEMPHGARALAFEYTENKEDEIFITCQVDSYLISMFSSLV